MKVSLALVLLLAAASGVRSADPPKNDSPGAYECAWENPDKPGEKYDLLPMMNNEKDYTFTSKDSTGNVLNYWVNPCRATITSICGSNSATCQQWDPTRDDGKASLGSTTTAKIIGQNLDEQKEKGGFTIEFTGGTTAQPSGQARQMEIDFICDPTGDGMGTPEYSGEQPALHYNIKWTTKMACPVAGGALSPGSIILIVLASLIFVYFVGGIIFMKFVKHAEGIEIIPNVEFWVAIPGLVKDGCLFIGSKTCCRNQSFTQV
jgi:1,2-dihydroxy-3-keto-5-methylthiopentene dioxygenase